LLLLEGVLVHIIKEGKPVSLLMRLFLVLELGITLLADGIDVYIPSSSYLEILKLYLQSGMLKAKQIP